MKSFPYCGLFIDFKFKHFLDASYQTLIQWLKIDRLHDNPLPSHRQAIPCVSARSGLDLYLTAKAFPLGSEIIVSALNIPDIETIIEAHQLTAMSCDIELSTLSPKLEQIQALITDKTVAVLIAQLYGRRQDLTKVQKLADQHGLILIEDLAQSLFEYADLSFHQIDCTLLSFGILKKQTALGGGILLLKDTAIAESIQNMLNSLPKVSIQHCLSRYCKYTLLTLLTNNTWMNRLFIYLTQYTIFSGLADSIKNSFKAYPQDLFTQLRKRPNRWMLSLIQCSLKQLKQQHTIAAHNHLLGKQLNQGLSAYFTIPGMLADKVNHWLFPVLIDDPSTWQNTLHHQGIFSFCSTSLTLIGHIKPEHPTLQAQKFMSQVIHLPLQLNMTQTTTQELIQRITAIISKHADYD